jgi:4-alpha-glucanotransferase
MPEPTRFGTGRHAGALVPLSSIPSRASWGVGEIADLPRFARWLAAASLDIVQLLPVNEMADGQNSPYSALSAMAIDPIFIALSDVPEFVEAGGEATLRPHEQADLERVRKSPNVEFRRVRALKARALRAAYLRFEEESWNRGGERATRCRDFMARESWWLDDYALFRALHAESEARYWLDWDAPLRDRESAALDEARARLWREIRYRAWLQWIAGEQWQRAREACGRVGIFGDFPFVVSSDSADVWARQHEFRVDASVGVPPDAFSVTGQDWGLPCYRWDVVERGGYEWLRQRAGRCASLFDGFRVDHLVGFYRTFFRESNGASAFTPPDEPSQLAQGERLLRLLADSGARIIAEDLGTVPDFVRGSLTRLAVPGLKVMRWEREWHTVGHPFREPSSYPPVSVATTGTHDTETLAEWWDTAPRDERDKVCALSALRGVCSPDEPFSDRVRDALLAALFGAASDILLLPVQDIFGWRDRINTPAVVDDVNWTWRLPWPVEDMAREPEAVDRAAAIRALVEHRGG